jgi:RecA-family ATPase
MTAVDRFDTLAAKAMAADVDTDSQAAALLHEQLVREELRRLRARTEARQIFEAERLSPQQPFDAGTLREILARPTPPPNRIDQLVPSDASTLIPAQRKTGKTTFVLNLTRSLTTGEDFLGRFGVRPLDGIVTMLNYEVSGATLAKWAEDVGIDPDRLYLVNLRGRRNPLAYEEDRTRLATDLRARGTEALITDPFGRAYTGTNQNDAGEVGAFLTSLDQFARAEVGARDLFLTTHAGWNMERTRGSTALEDWADSIITMTRADDEDSAGERYLRAIGRDVDLEDHRLSFDATTRRLTLAEAGSRKTAAA